MKQRPRTQLSDLKQLWRQTQQERLQLAQQVAEQQRQLKQRQSEGVLFRQAVGQVEPIKSQNRVQRPPTRPEPIPRSRLQDEQGVLRESLSDEFDAESLLHTDEDLAYVRVGVGVDVLRRLRRGEWTLQAELDLHGFRRDQAREAVSTFIREAVQYKLRCVRIVHGKGLGSPGREPILKNKVRTWLVQKKEVLAFVQARPIDGGAGALIVLLEGTRPLKPSSTLTPMA